MAKRTRPSSVLGTSSAAAPGRKALLTTMCAPRLNTTPGPGPGSSISRKASAKGPVAFTTTAPRATHSPPPTRSRTLTPLIAPPDSTRPVTSAWLRAAQFRLAAVRTSAQPSRVSSNWPSWKSTPPRNPRSSRVESRFRHCRRDNSREPPSPLRHASASYALSPVPYQAFSHQRYAGTISARLCTRCGALRHSRRRSRSAPVHHLHLALPQIAHAAVDQLGAAARGPPGEVAALDQEGAVPTGRRVQRGRDPRAPAAHDNHVPGTQLHRAIKHSVAG